MSRAGFIRLPEVTAITSIMEDVSSQGLTFKYQIFYPNERGIKGGVFPSYFVNMAHFYENFFLG